MSPAVLAAVRSHASALRALDNVRRADTAYTGDNLAWMLERAQARYESTGRVLLALLAEDKSLPLTVEVRHG